MCSEIFGSDSDGSENLSDGALLNVVESSPSPHVSDNDEELETRKQLRRRIRRLRRKISWHQRKRGEKKWLIRKLRWRLQQVNAVDGRNSEERRELVRATFNAGFEACKAKLRARFGDALNLDSIVP